MSTASLNAAATPATADSDRLDSVDALRGFALLGILLVNIAAFASAFYGQDIPDPAFDAPLDRSVRFLVSLLFETKFYLLFSFLFGYSFTLQMRSAERAGASLTQRLRRRMAGLWLFGALHAVLLFHGDILTSYALLGFALLALRRWDDARLLRLAAWLIGLTALAWGLLAGLLALGSPPTDHALILAEAQAATRAYRASAASVVAQHLRELPTVGVVLVFVQAPCALAMFLVGLVAGRREVLARVHRHRPLLRRLLGLGLLIGLPGAAVYAYSAVYLLDAPALALAGFSIGLASAPLLTGAYIALAMWCFERSPRLRGLLAPAGRMALTNYLLQSFACALIFHAYGLSLIGQLAPLPVLLIALALFALQLLISRWWMNRFAYGGLEWLLRAITLGRWPAWHKARGNTSGDSKAASVGAG